MSSNHKELLEWEQELLADHRWGRWRQWFPDDQEIINEKKIAQEHSRLKTLWRKAQPLSQPDKAILRAIINLEICNWRLEDGILELCKAIGTHKAPQLKIGHAYSITDERWEKLWAYYLTLKGWLRSTERLAGYQALLKVCDPKGEIQPHILGMLGERTILKELYVARFCLNLDYWLGGFFPEDSPQLLGYNAAVGKLEEKIIRLGGDPTILDWMRLDGKLGWFEVCHHKAFRRLDITISSIGIEKWRGIPRRGTDGLERAATLEKYLVSVEAWLNPPAGAGEPPERKLFNQINALLGKHDATKTFLASLLVSLLRPQQIAAKKRAENRIESQKGTGSLK